MRKRAGFRAFWGLGRDSGGTRVPGTRGTRLPCSQAPALQMGVRTAIVHHRRTARCRLPCTPCCTCSQRTLAQHLLLLTHRVNNAPAASCPRPCCEQHRRYTRVLAAVVHTAARHTHSLNNCAAGCVRLLQHYCPRLPSDAPAFCIRPLPGGDGVDGRELGGWWRLGDALTARRH
jgi:hypothetical protein